MNNGKHAGLSLGLLVGCLVSFELLPADIWVQSAFFDAGMQRWLWDGNDPILRTIFYSGPKAAYILGVACLLVALLLAKRSALLRSYRDGIRIVLLSLIVIPLCVGALKSATDVACPKDLTLYGGAFAYEGVVADDAERPALVLQRCFPAGHASGGFALLSLFFLFKSKRNRRRALWLGLSAGWGSGLYKMSIGDHFLSHTIASMLIAWLLVNAIVLVHRRVCGWRLVTRLVRKSA
jgi:membrane-associated PAP2 superfamily phosphatase